LWRTDHRHKASTSGPHRGISEPYDERRSAAQRLDDPSQVPSGALTFTLTDRYQECNDFLRRMFVFLVRIAGRPLRPPSGVGRIGKAID
jgi:hypothetical protein